MYNSQMRGKFPLCHKQDEIYYTPKNGHLDSQPAEQLVHQIAILSQLF